MPNYLFIQLIASLTFYMFILHYQQSTCALLPFISINKLTFNGNAN